MDTPDDDARKVLEGLAGELEPQVEKLRVSGDLTKPRKPGDYTNRYPDAWVRTHRLLARFGEEQRLRRLLDAYVLDFNTYPEAHAPLIPMVRAVMSSTGPTLVGAIHAADASPSHLVERLQKLVPDRTQWTSPPLAALRASLDPTSDKSAEQPHKEPTESDIVKLLGDSDPNKRAEGWQRLVTISLSISTARFSMSQRTGRGWKGTPRYMAWGSTAKTCPRQCCVSS
jgi:hypothetical protein